MPNESELKSGVDWRGIEKIIRGMRARNDPGSLELTNWLADNRDIIDAITRPAPAQSVNGELLAALNGLLINHDWEDRVIHTEPSPGCIECTSGTTPNHLNAGLCPLHKAERAVKGTHPPNDGWMTIDSAPKDKTILAKCFIREEGDLDNWYPAVIYWANETWNGQNEYTTPRPFSWKEIK